MRLRYTTNSPFARKVRVLAHELGIADSIELVSTALRTEDPGFWADNPVAKVPVLITEGGLRLSDSNVICEYLEATRGGGRLLAASGAPRWQALTLVSLADAVVEAAIQARIEKARPPEQQQGARIEQEMARLGRGLDAIQDAVRGDLPGEPVFALSGIAIACALGWLELRMGADVVFGSRPELARWWALAQARPSMLATRPDPNA